MLLSRWLTLSFLVIVLSAEDRGPVETERISQAIAELDHEPVAVAVNQLRLTLKRENELHTQPLREQLVALMKTPEYQAYADRRRDLQAQRDGTWPIERKAMADSAQKIYAARHAELRQHAPAELPLGRALGFDLLTYPRIDGSTSTSPLGVVMACRLLDTPYAWLYPAPRGAPWINRDEDNSSLLQGALLPGEGKPEFELTTLKLAARPNERRHERIAPVINSLLAAHSSTHVAYVNLIEGRADLNLTARMPSLSELTLAAEKGVVLRTEVIARDAFVMVVHVRNPVTSLSRQQIRDIYENRITSWNEVGGGDHQIRAFRRQRDSGSRELFDELVMDGRTASGDEHRVDNLYSHNMGGPFSRLTQDPQGIGYSIYYYDHFMAASPYTRPLAIDGVEPNAETIASGAYPWVTSVYVAYREGEAADSPAMRLMRWLLTPEGQTVVRESGYVPAR